MSVCNVESSRSFVAKAEDGIKRGDWWYRTFRPSVGVRNSYYCVAPAYALKIIFSLSVVDIRKKVRILKLFKTVLNGK